MKKLAYALVLLLLTVAAKTDKKYYTETYRPQFHFSPEKDWLFEPNGFVYYRGEYHLFYQNVAINNKVMHSQLGHAVSKDLVHWEHLPYAFTPDEKATDMTSCRPMAGCAVVDSMNVAKLQQKEEKTLLLFYSDNKGNQHLAYSNDKGVTWTKYAGNPVVRNIGGDAHDPKVFYYPPTGKWIMALYRAPGEGAGAEGTSFFTSADLLHWEFKSHLEGFGECPDIFEVPLEGKATEKKWVVLSGEGDYRIGSFDGQSFQPETRMQKLDLGKNFFAAQTLAHSPDGKVIQIGWMRGGEYPEMPFNGQMSFPTELSLKSTKKGMVLCRKPVTALTSLIGHDLVKKNKNMIPGLNNNLLSGIKGDAVFIKAVFQPKSSDNFGITLRNGKKSSGTDIRYEPARKILEVNGIKTILETIDDKIELQILMDRSSIEVFANHGEIGISTCFTPQPGDENLLLFTQGGELFVESLEAYTLKSAWQKGK